MDTEKERKIDRERERSKSNEENSTNLMWNKEHTRRETQMTRKWKIKWTEDKVLDIGMKKKKRKLFLSTKQR